MSDSQSKTDSGSTWDDEEVIVRKVSKFDAWRKRCISRKTFAS